MTIYHYAESGEYVTSTEARLDPLEAGQFLIPRNATPTAPPSVVENEIAVFADGAWTLSEDWRGTQYWLAEDYDEEEAPHTVKELGPLTVGALLTRPEVPSEIQSERDAAAAQQAFLDAGWDTGNGYRLKIDENTQARLTALLVGINLKVERGSKQDNSTVKFFDMDGVVQTETVGSLKQILEAYNDFVTTLLGLD